MKIFSDLTTTQETLREKAKNYALNFLTLRPEIPFKERETIAGKIADEIEKHLKHHDFYTTPNAVRAANREREKVGKKPEEQFIKLKL